MNSNETKNKFDIIFSQTSHGTIFDNNSVVSSFTDILNGPCNILPMNGPKKVNSKRNTTTPKQKWYTKDCHLLKKNLRNLGSLLTIYPNNTYLKHIFFAKKKEYKRQVRRLRRQFHNTMLEKIEDFANSNPREYWKLNYEKTKHLRTMTKYPPLTGLNTLKI